MKKATLSPTICFSCAIPAEGGKQNQQLRRISVQTLAVDFKIPWDFLAKTNAETENAETKTGIDSKMWCLLEKVRTHFEQNPDL